MQQRFSHNALEVCYTYKPGQKHTYISIKDDGSISLRSPIKSIKKLTAIIEAKEPWITAQLTYKARLPKAVLGKEVLFLGECMSLDHDVVTQLQRAIDRLKVLTDDAVEKCYQRFYKEQCELYLPQRIEYFSNLMQLQAERISYRKMRRRWGSCDSKKHVTFNSAIMKLSPEQIDYIIVHELAHIKHMNHSIRFHTLVQHYISDAQRIEKSLRHIQP